MPQPTTKTDSPAAADMYKIAYRVTNVRINLPCFGGTRHVFYQAKPNVEQAVCDLYHFVTQDPVKYKTLQARSKGWHQLQHYLKALGPLPSDNDAQLGTLHKLESTLVSELEAISAPGWEIKDAPIYLMLDFDHVLIPFAPVPAMSTMWVFEWIEEDDVWLLEQIRL